MGMQRAISLSGAAFVLLCIVVVLLAAPVGAQDSGGIPPGTAANGVDTDDNNSPPDAVLVAADACTVSPGASITLEDGDGTQARFVDGELEVTISEQDGSPKIEGPVTDYIGDHATFPDADTAFETDGDYSVVSSTGITCEGGGAPDDGSTPPTDDGAAPAGDKEVPVDDQYDKVDKPGGPPGDVSNPKDVVPGTDAKKKVPVTGGPPLIVLAAAGLLLSGALISGLGLMRR
jgi:hypothetical protein